ncbi:cation diffusion facilitator family transporter [Pontibacter arcticus]|uniref:Cation transporter n=1 Tax=Pontibacter arcticus TaxID=2080288 RepID=A0A364RC28_9BACT|nr:cation diffusion facilitator family transporter [Pontibacter arcticus]RAU81716.1 cation transporter [Pontibacter arcticus]
MAAPHNHDHGHHHHAGSNIKLAFFLNLSFALLELFGGAWINSVAILSDALHDLGDSLALGLAWYFEKLSVRGRDLKYTFGYKRFSLLGAVINAVILLAGSVLILSEAIPRVWQPEQVNATGMIGFAVLGILVNGAAVLKLKDNSLNERVVRLHLLEDVLGWVAVLVGGIILYFFDFPIIDPLLSIGISVYVIYNAFKNLRASMNILLQAAPIEVNLTIVQQKLEELPAIQSIHDLHIWTLDGTTHILTLHAIVDKDVSLLEAESIKQQIRDRLSDLQINHVTLELEIPGQPCSQQQCPAEV